MSYREPWYKACGYMNSEVIKDNILLEKLKSYYNADIQATVLQGNVYYVGKIWNFDIEFNTDWYWNKSVKICQRRKLIKKQGSNL